MTDYVELHCHSYFSLLDGASSPEKLIEEVSVLGMTSLALTDHDNLYGAVVFSQAALQAGIQPIFGAEVTLSDGAHLTLLVESAQGWQNLCRLISTAQLNSPKGQSALPFDVLAQHTEGLIALSGCSHGHIPDALRRRDRVAAQEAAHHYSQLFGEAHFWIELQHHLTPEDDHLNQALHALAEQIGLGVVATNNVHYARRDDHRLQQVLTCIRHGVALEEAEALIRPNSEYYLKDRRRLMPLFKNYPHALDNTLSIADQCRFELTYGLQDLPRFVTPHRMKPLDYLYQLCENALPRWYGDDAGTAATRLTHELAIIERAGLANYFLIVWDIVRFAREHRILCQGRGSAANSLVAYLLGITPIDPLRHDLVFERFLSDERQLAPDIDIDFQADRREEVIQYIYETYGPEHTAMACTFVTFRARSALRDVGKALGLPQHFLTEAAQTLEFHPRAGELAHAVDMTHDTPLWDQLFDLCRQIDHVPRHLGIHNGGMIVTGSPLIERIPIEPATMPKRVVVQWDKESLEDAGLVKIDILGLRMLSALAETLPIIEATTGTQIDLSGLTFDDPAVYAMITAADTIGVFQVESRAQSQLLPRLRPTCFEDLIVAISLIRPGPIQGNMVHPYVRRRRGEEPVTYAHPLLIPALRETLGVILFQDQVLKVARDLAGFTPGQGELLRRALGGKRPAEDMARLETTFIEGAKQKGVPPSVAQHVFESLLAFGGYSFPKSHAAAFAVIVYQSAWLKCYYPAAFIAALLNHQPMGFWSPAVLVNEARRHGIEVRSVDIAHSAGRCTLEHSAIRLGLNYVKGFGDDAIDRLLTARTKQFFQDLPDLCRRTHLPRRLVERLILAGALDRWQVSRRKLLWELGRIQYTEDELALVYPEDDISIHEFTETEKLHWEYEVLGVTTGPHPMALCRAWLHQQGMVTSATLKTLPDKTPVKTAGLVVVHQAPPTANGFHFLTLEDECGLLDLIVSPAIYEQYSRVLRQAAILMVVGVVQQEADVTNILVQQAAKLPMVSG